MRRAGRFGFRLTESRPPARGAFEKCCNALRVGQHFAHMAKIFLCAILSLLALRASADGFTKLFDERAKCAVTVKFILEMEEDRTQIVLTGTLMNEEGVVLLPPGEIPNVPSRCFKDFRAFVHNGDADGYPAEFLGVENLVGFGFARIKGPLPDCMVACSKFERAKFETGQFLWGVGVASEENSYLPYCLRSYVSLRNPAQIEVGNMGGAIGGVGCPVFDSEGRIVGCALSRERVERLMILPDSNRLSVGLIGPNSAAIVSIADADAALGRIPKDPDGDPYGWLGIVGIRFLKKDVSKFLGISDKFGLVISDIIKDSPAQKAGLRKGDIIVGMNGKPLERLNSDNDSREKFVMALRAAKPGEKISLSVVREAGGQETVGVVMGESPRDSRKADFKYFRRLGFSIVESTMDDAIARRILDGLPDFPIVRFVKPNSPASSATPAPLSEGDVIREINSKPVKTYSEAVEILSKINADESAKEAVILAEGFRETKVVKIKLD